MNVKSPENEVVSETATLESCELQEDGQMSIKLSGSCLPDAQGLSGSWLSEIGNGVETRGFDSAVGSRWAKVNVGRIYDMSVARSDDDNGNFCEK